MAMGDGTQGRIPDITGHEHLSQRICQPCLGEDNLIGAIGLCVDCQVYLCSKCFDHHNIKQHRVLGKEQILRGQAKANPTDTCSDSCPVHENEIIQYYCASHCHLGCKSCINLDHAKCGEVHYIPNESKDLVNNEDYKQGMILLRSVLDTFLNVFQNAQRNAAEVNKSCVDALRELHYFKTQVNEVLGNIESELVEKVRALRLKANQELADIRKKYKAAYEELQSSLAKIEVVQEAKQNCSSYIEIMKAKAKVKSLDYHKQQAEVDASYKQSPVQFYPNEELLELLRHPFGFGSVSSTGTRDVLSWSDEISMVSDTETENVVSWSDDFSVISDTQSMISQPSSRIGNILHESDAGDNLSVSSFGTQDYHIREFNVKAALDNCWIPGLVVLSNSWLVLTDCRSGSIKTVDLQTGRIVEEFEAIARPWDITSIENNTVAFTVPDRKKIVIHTVKDNELSPDRTLAVDGKCWGIDFSNGKLAVSFITPHKIRILNLEGRVLNSIMSNKSGEALLYYPRYLTFGQDDTTLYVSNTNHNVVCVNQDGTVVAVYRDRDLKGPRKAVVDSSGNVYVCDQSSNTVHQITKDCKKLRVLLAQADGLDRPYSICLSEEEDKLYVGMRNSDYVKLYRIERNEPQ